MKDRSAAFLLTFGGFSLGVIVVALVFTFARTKHESSTAEPPKLAGQAVPANLISIDFERRYDLYCKGQDDKTSVVFKNMAILGFTGPTFRTLKARFARIIPDTLQVRGAVGANRHGQKS